MASSSRIPADPVRLTEVRHDQRRVAALLNASGQLKVSILPHASIPVQDLYKSRFYRQLQASRSSLPARVPPLGHPLVRLPGWKQTDKDNPLVSNQYGHVTNGGHGEQIGGTTRSAHDQLHVGTNSYSRRRQAAVDLERTLSKSVPSSLGLERIIKSSNRNAKSLSRYESLPDIGAGRNTDVERSKVEFRLPRRGHREQGIDLITEGKTAPPHLQYNHGIANPGRPDPPSISQIFSPTGWLREDTDHSDVAPLSSRKTHHRKRKQSVTTPVLMRTYDHDEVPLNSPESSTVSMDKPSSSHSDMSSSDTIFTPVDLYPDDDGHNINELGVDEHKSVTSPPNDPESSVSGPSDLKVHSPAPKGSLGSGLVNPNDDPYGTAYLKALSVARSKAAQKDPFYLSQRMTRPFTFSYFCQKEVCVCGNCPKMKRKKGKTGLKSILGDVNMYDYFKWSKDKKDKP